MIAFFAGILFALIAQYARLNTFDKIISGALFKRIDVFQIMAVAIAVSSIGFFIQHLLGEAAIGVKPFYLVGVTLGGVLFGVGVAILGYCPGTMTMAIAEGKIDALFGYAGGILAGAVFTIIYPFILPMIGPNFGELTLYSSNNALSMLIVVIYAGALLLAALKIWPALAGARNANTDR